MTSTSGIRLIEEWWNECLTLSCQLHKYESEFVVGLDFSNNYNPWREWVTKECMLRCFNLWLAEKIDNKEFVQGRFTRLFACLEPRAEQSHVRINYREKRDKAGVFNTVGVWKFKPRSDYRKFSLTHD